MEIVSHPVHKCVWINHPNCSLAFWTEPLPVLSVWQCSVLESILASSYSASIGSSKLEVGVNEGGCFLLFVPQWFAHNLSESMFTLACLSLARLGTIQFVGVYMGVLHSFKRTIFVPPSMRGQASWSKSKWWRNYERGFYWLKGFLFKGLEWLAVKTPQPQHWVFWKFVKAIFT